LDILERSIGSVLAPRTTDREDAIPPRFCLANRIEANANAVNARSKYRLRSCRSGKSNGLGIDELRADFVVHVLDLVSCRRPACRSANVEGSVCPEPSNVETAYFFTAWTARLTAKLPGTAIEWLSGVQQYSRTAETSLEFINEFREYSLRNGETPDTKHQMSPTPKVLST
jgi:hypothetical protein